MLAFGIGPTRNISERDRDSRHWVEVASGEAQSAPCKNGTTVRALVECNLCGKSITALRAVTLALPTYACPFLPTTDGYMGLLCEALPTNYALMCEAHTVQMHTPSKVIN